MAENSMDESADWTTDDNTPLIVIANAVMGQTVPSARVVIDETTDDEALINKVPLSRYIDLTASRGPQSPESVSSDVTVDDKDDPDWCEASSEEEHPPHHTKTKRGPPLPSKTRKRARRRGQIVDNELELAIATSASAVQSKKRELAEHQSKLSNILTANGYYKTTVPADGNCFFASAACHITDYDATTLRQVLCQYLEQHIFEYLEFLTNNDTTLDDIKKLRASGIWNNAAGDFLPRALADWSGKTVVIFTSNLYSPQHIFQPKESTANDSNPITLSLLTVEASHYEPVFLLPRTHGYETAVPRPCFTPNAAPPPCTTHADCATPNADSLPCSSGTPSAAPSPCATPNADCATPIADCATPNADCATQNADSLPCSPCSVREAPEVETPRKHGQFNTPPKKELFRKRRAKTETWKKNSRKRLRLRGEEYVSEAGKIRPARKVKPIDCSKCRFHCSRISDENRELIFQTFYSDEMPYDRRKDFVCSNVREVSTRKYLDEDNKPVPQKRKVARTYSFCISGQTERVCKKFFLATLDINESYVDHALRNCEHGTFKGRDGRGRHRPHNKTPEILVERAKQHIESFPVVESHYTRKDTQRKYLPADLNIKKMYELHKEECEKLGIPCVTARRYRSIFNENYNFSFHVPKKDQCSKCTLHAEKKKLGTLTEDLEKYYQEHQKRKADAQKQKDKDKDRAMKDRSLHVITVDLQAVLPTPCAAVSQLYYKRKLSVYNFTTYSLADKNAVCYLWDETEARRGACEIATCLFAYVSSLKRFVTDVIIFSDCCSSQNRNQYLATCFMHAVNTIPNIKTITHKYLESGHTHMECDSMHAAITHAKKNTPIFEPYGWDMVINLARRHKPYLCLPIKWKDVLDWKKVAHSRIRNTKKDTDGNKVEWLNIKVIQFRKGIEDQLFFKYDHEDAEYKTLDLVGPAKRGIPEFKKKGIPRLYSGKQPITEAKKRDLLYLCNAEIIPTRYHAFYKDLPVSATVKDKLPDQDVDESDEDTN